jgi:hypothetical protein
MFRMFKTVAIKNKTNSKIMLLNIGKQVNFKI